MQFRLIIFNILNKKHNCRNPSAHGSVPGQVPPRARTGAILARNISSPLRSPEASRITELIFPTGRITETKILRISMI